MMFAACDQRACTDECATCHTRIGLEAHHLWGDKTYHVRYICSRHLDGETYEVHSDDGSVSTIGFSSPRVIPGQTTLADHLRQQQVPPAS